MDKQNQAESSRGYNTGNELFVCPASVSFVINSMLDVTLLFIHHLTGFPFPLLLTFLQYHIITLVGWHIIRLHLKITYLIDLLSNLTLKRWLFPILTTSSFCQFKVFFFSEESYIFCIVQVFSFPQFCVSSHIYNLLFSLVCSTSFSGSFINFVYCNLVFSLFKHCWSQFF